MASDLQNPPDASGQPEIAPKKTSGRILAHEVEEGLKALEAPTGRLFISGCSAGLDLGFSLLLIAILQTLSQGMPSSPSLELLRAVMYSFGYVIVVLGRSELFTEQTSLAVLPLWAGVTTVKKIGRLWGIVLVANMLGSAAFALIAVVIGPAMNIVDRHVFEQMASATAGHPWWVILLSGVLAGWLMGLVSWLVAAGRDTIGQIVIIATITSVIGLAHLHHAILITSEMLAGVFSGGKTTLADFAYVLVWTLLGNAIGGPVFVSLKYGLSGPGPGEAEPGPAEN